MSETALARGEQILRSRNRFLPEQVDALVNFLRDAGEDELFRTSPLRFARTSGIAERDAIDLFLHATHAGLLEFTWGVLCPACTAFLHTRAALSSLSQERFCTMCSVPVHFADDAVEVAFTVSPSVRKIRFHDPERLEFDRDGMRTFFSPSTELEDALKQKVAGNTLWHGRVGAGGSTETKLTLEPASHGYGFVVPSQHAWVRVTVSEDATADTIELDCVKGRLFPERATVRPGSVTLRFHNRTSSSVMFGLIRSIPYEVLQQGRRILPFLSGKRLVTTQSFRELFRAESVPSGAGLEFKSLTVLFTDLKGSTELYERIGDFRAYQLVREHFDVLRDIIDASGGAMVKTIGDAIMASFAEIEPAMDAAVRMNERISGIGDGALQLKIGLHNGPCIAVELNEQLDYFGQTVNVASRVQNLASGGEIVCTEPIWASTGVQRRAQSAGLRSDRDQARLKGVDGEVTVYRLRAA